MRILQLMQVNSCRRLGRPLLVYQGIDERYPHANARHHNVLLDAAVDMHHGCKRWALTTLCMLQEGKRPPVMKTFAAQASLIITDLFPLPPWKNWVQRIAEIARCPVLEIDCHCVASSCFGKRWTDRSATVMQTKKLRKRRVGVPWLKPQVEKSLSWNDELPFELVEISDLTNPDKRLRLLQSCNIDMGSSCLETAWRRACCISKMERFLANRLSGYARRRNNAADSEGVSRLSMAIHYGMISVMKIVREAHEVGTKAAEKFLDELLISVSMHGTMSSRKKNHMGYKIYLIGPLSRGKTRQMMFVQHSFPKRLLRLEILRTTSGICAKLHSTDTVNCTTTYE